MQRSLIPAFGLALIAFPAWAADLPRHHQPYQAPTYVAGFNWTGFYAGLHVGYGWGSSRDIDMRGGFFGGQIGYNWQGVGNPWVFGVEFDSAWADMGNTKTYATGAGAVPMTSDSNYTGSLRARIGYAFDRTLAYATGGLAWMRNTNRVNATIGPFIAGAENSNTHIGAAIGAGIEHAFAPRLTGKIEYMYTGYGRETYFGGVAGGVGLNAGSHTLKVGVNYLFR